MQKLASHCIRIGWCVCVVLCCMSACWITPPDVTGWFCSSNQDCLSPLICDQQSKKCAMPCFSVADCPSGQSCIRSFCTTQIGQKDASTKDKICDPSAQELCNGIDDNCNNQVDEGIACASEGSLCDLSAKTPIPCKPGFVCESFTVLHPRTCLKLCKPEEPTSCGDARLSCLRLGTGSHHVCVEANCSTKKKCKFESEQGVPHSCDTLSANTRICRPFYPSGKAAFGQACRPNKNIFCVSPAQCARRNTDSIGLCTRRCSKGDHASCSNFFKGSKCTYLEGKFFICVPPCQTNADCPEHMSCREGVCAF